MSKIEKKVMLIVENDETLLRSLYLLFYKRGFIIASATDGNTAFKMTQRLKPAVVLLDLELPKMSGLEYLKNLKVDVNIKKIPVIILSNPNDENNITKAKGLGVVDNFIKSDRDVSSLVDKVNKFLKS